MRQRLRGLQGLTKYTQRNLFITWPTQIGKNHLFYKTLPLCPCCVESEETFEHVLRCPSLLASNNRDQSLQELIKGLKSIHTPDPIFKAILHGTNHWVNHPSVTALVHAPIFGSVYPRDVLLTDAFLNNFTPLGGTICSWATSAAGGSRLSRHTLFPMAHYSQNCGLRMLLSSTGTT
jgi:hypothetical protein